MQRWKKSIDLNKREREKERAGDDWFFKTDGTAVIQRCLPKMASVAMMITYDRKRFKLYNLHLYTRSNVSEDADDGQLGGYHVLGWRLDDEEAKEKDNGDCLWYEKKRINKSN